jgi:hypothetical protein
MDSLANKLEEHKLISAYNGKVKLHLLKTFFVPTPQKTQRNPSLDRSLESHKEDSTYDVLGIYDD